MAAETTLPPEALAAPCSPENHTKWVAVTSTTLSKARNQASTMLTRLQNYEAAEAAAKGAAMEQAKREKEALQAKARGRIKMHEAIIDGSAKGIRAIEDAVYMLEGVLSDLTHERYARFADTQVNQKRSDIRGKRPISETYKDFLDTNLEKEKHVLSGSRTELLQREAEVRTKVKDLQEQRNKLSYDIGARRLQVEFEQHLLRPGFSAPVSPPSPAEPRQDQDAGNQQAPDQTMLPGVPGAEKAEKTSGARRSEKAGGEAPDQTTPPGAPGAEKAEKPSGARRSEKAGSEAPDQTTLPGVPGAEKAEKPSSAKKSEKAGSEKPCRNCQGSGVDEKTGKPCTFCAVGREKFKAYIASLPLSGEEAMANVKKTDQMLANVDEFCAKSAAAIEKSRGEGLVATSAVTKALAKRTIDMHDLKRNLEEHIRDVNYAIVQAERSLEKQAKRLDPKDTSKKEQMEATQDLLAQLRQTKKKLVQDLRSKIAALDLDNSCRRVTPQVAAEQKPGTNTRSLTRLSNASASAPNLNRKLSGSLAADGDNGTSKSPGSSKTLKTAGSISLPAAG